MNSLRLILVAGIACSGCTAGYNGTVGVTVDSGGKVGVLAKLGGTVALGEQVFMGIEPRVGMGIDSSLVPYGTLDVAPVFRRDIADKAFVLGPVFGFKRALTESTEEVRLRVGISGFMALREEITEVQSRVEGSRDVGIHFELVGVRSGTPEGGGALELFTGLQYRSLNFWNPSHVRTAPDKTALVASVDPAWLIRSF